MEILLTRYELISESISTLIVLLSFSQNLARKKVQEIINFFLYNICKKKDKRDFKILVIFKCYIKEQEWNVLNVIQADQILFWQ